ncbi:MAG: MFS transporter, partial [Chlamydiae bacterium]|nr:MFS transporter [Chlamydiota bacterium]
MSLIDLSKKRFASIIFAISFGNFLEWYELSLYVYWAPILSKLFFSGDDIVALIKIFMIFGVGFLARPLGGIFFGRLGDRIGRRKSLILSILLMTFPTFITGLLPTYAQIGIAAPLLLGVMRILQSFPAGGEFPGAFCYLYESAPLSKRRFMCSWAGIGYQLGIFFGMIGCFMLKQLLTEDQIIEWGWRFSFILGGILGLFGLFLRSNLHETPLFLEMQEHEKLTRQSFKRVIIENKKPMILGILFTAASSSTFYALSINFLKDGSKGDILLSMFFFALLTLPLPLYGMFGDRYNNKRA